MLSGALKCSQALSHPYLTHPATPTRHPSFAFALIARQPRPTRPSSPFSWPFCARSLETFTPDPELVCFSSCHFLFFYNNHYSASFAPSFLLFGLSPLLRTLRSSRRNGNKTKKRLAARCTLHHCKPSLNCQTSPSPLTACRTTEATLTQRDPSVCTLAAKEPSGCF